VPDLQFAVTAVVAVFGSAAGGGIISGWMNKSKTSAEAEASAADATQKLTATAMQLIAPLEAQVRRQGVQLAAQDEQLARQGEEIRGLRGQLADRDRGDAQRARADEQEKARIRLWVRQHTEWDTAAIAAVRPYGLELPPPPPLYPPSAEVHA
jgi:uncharacterized protein HemX